MKKKLLFIISLFINISFIFSQNWTLAASKFEVSDSLLTTEAEKSGLDIVANQLPSLILSYLPENVNRTIEPEEFFARELFNLQKERQSLYSSLTNQIKTRDAFVFNYEGIELKKKFESSKDSIEKIEKNIKQNELDEAELYKEFNENKNKKNTISKVAFYQNNSETLFDIENLNSKEKISSASVHGLITGKIYPYGNYIKVESTLTLYPEEKVLVKVTEVGLVSEVEYIASSIMNQILGYIINADLINADILIFPQEAGEKATIFIEDLVLRGKSVSTTFTPGSHSIRVESEGYETIYFSHDFVANQDKTITINMKKINQVDTYLFVKEKKEKSQFDLSSEIYLNSLYLGNNPISVSVSDKSYLGEVVSNSDKNLYSFFVLNNGYTSEILQNKKTKNDSQAVALKVELPEAKHDLSKKIDKSRKRMYWSYGGLILSLPLYYFSKGTYELCHENNSFIDPSSLNTWKTLSDISLYTVIGNGVNFITQLILYLVDANKVVPKVIEPKVIDESEKENLDLQIEKTRELEKQKEQEKNDVNLNMSEKESSDEIKSEDEISSEKNDNDLSNETLLKEDVSNKSEQNNEEGV